MSSIDTGYPFFLVKRGQGTVPCLPFRQRIREFVERGDKEPSPVPLSPFKLVCFDLVAAFVCGLIDRNDSHVVAEAVVNFYCDDIADFLSQQSPAYR